MSKAVKSLLLALVTVFILQSCATLDPDYEEPSVMLTSFKPVSSNGAIPEFRIGLRIINPNPDPLKLEGVVYSISLRGHELVKGVGKDYPVIDGYSEGDIKLTASPNIISGIRFISDLTKNQGEPLEYTFKAKLDVGGLYPSLRISETGTFNTGQ
jgi:LEA14-like dessication related protein